MRVIDLSHYLSPDMSLYPGTPLPEITPLASVAEQGYAVSRLNITTHIGTHIDAPAHMLAGAATLDQLPVSHFIGQAVVIRLRGLDQPQIGLADLLPHAARIAHADFVLLETGWSDYWRQPAYLEGFPALSIAAVEWLAQQKLKGIGVDNLSVDAIDAAGFSVHDVVFKHGMINIENLTNLAELPDTPFLFSCLPLRYPNADGSPVRAVALLAE